MTQHGLLDFCVAASTEVVARTSSNVRNVLFPCCFARAADAAHACDTSSQRDTPHMSIRRTHALTHRAAYTEADPFSTRMHCHTAVKFAKRAVVLGIIMHIAQPAEFKRRRGGHTHAFMFGAPVATRRAYTGAGYRCRPTASRL